MKKIILFLLVLFNVNVFSQENSKPVELGKHFSIKSKVLNEERYVSVFLPAGYNLNERAKYPVVYMLDGDYNFFHLTGLVEQLSTISEKIPEMIVVGISDKGQKAYIKNLTPTDLENPDGDKSGRAGKFIEFIEKDLKPFMDKNYRTAPFDILMGHSIGGLFVLTTLTEKPDLFDAYVAISPSLWWNDAYLISRAEDVFKQNKTYNNTLFISLANEKGMKVDAYLELLEKYAPKGLDYEYKHYPDESHNSVGLKSMESAFAKIFTDWEFKPELFTDLEKIKTCNEKYRGFSEKMGYQVSLPPSYLLYAAYTIISEEDTEQLDMLKKTVLTHFLASEEDYYFKLGDSCRRLNKPEKGKEALLKGLKKFPNSVNINHTLGLIYEAENKVSQAGKYFKKALDTGIRLEARQWMLNYLKGDFDRVSK